MAEATPYICNAVIESTRLTIEDHGCLVGWITLNYGGSGQGFGGFVLGGIDGNKSGEHSKQPNFCAEFIVSVLQCAGVERWDQLVGKTLRVKKTDSWGDILAIGHIVNDLWFSPRETFAAMEKEVRK